MDHGHCPLFAGKQPVVHPEHDVPVREDGRTCRLDDVLDRGEDLLVLGRGGVPAEAEDPAGKRHRNARVDGLWAHAQELVAAAEADSAARPFPRSSPPMEEYRA